MTHRVRVNFDGPDLPRGFVPREFVLTVRYLGFRGGFGYLDGWSEEWSLPRRPTSRPVSRGSFAVAGNVAGFYPIDSPGGWNILGHTDYDLAYALAPGDTIVVTPTTESLPLPPLRETERPSLATRVHPADWSRVQRGMSPGGPFDDVAAAMLDAEELIECAMVWPRVEGVWVGPDLRTGDVVPTGRIEGGLRGYVGKRTAGVPPASGGHPARPDAAGRDARRVAGVPPAVRGNRHVIRAMRGPHDIGVDRIECEVTPKLDRVGIRLHPLTAIDIKPPADLKSIGMQCGTLQLHPDGSLVAMGPDHPVTGGYLQPMTVLAAERWKLAQLSPGERVTFVAD
jgi:Carboxyltransferase domain, subdomain A and B/Carboxyltransferase domain, subdomain C and D